ncbi:MAG: hypothetical protein JSW58_17520 [Candidatus Latescibacterota bacterium]|nr:MAG: hypothetical protein JSW58_17520 [Candidatus Latescibacterota bacterium]
MRRPRRRHLLAPGISGVITAAVLLTAPEVLATGELSGRLYLTYQHAGTRRASEEFFQQQLEATLRDKLYKDHDLKLNFFLSNDHNLTSKLTHRRYRGELHLAHRYYNFSARLSPRQKITPIELEASSETLANQVAVDIHVPHAPRLRFHYGRRSRYDLGALTGRSEAYRGDLTYRVKMFDFELNRWYTEGKDGTKNTTTVTGGAARLTQPFGPGFLFRSGYDYKLTENQRNGGEKLATANHAVKALMTGKYRELVMGSFVLNSRRLVPREESRPRTSDDNLQFLATAFPRLPLNVDLGWSYLRSKQEFRETLAEYATVQLVMEGDLREKVFGRTQLTKRFVIATRNGIIPANLFSVSLRSRIYEGVDAQGVLNVTQQEEDFAFVKRYQSHANLRFFLRPTSNIRVSPEVQFVKLSDSFSLSNFGSRVFKLVAVYSAAGRMNAGINLRKNVVTNGAQREELSATFTMGFTLRNRSSLNLSYGINDKESENGGSPAAVRVESHTTTFSVQAVVWITKRGSLSGNYTNADREGNHGSSYTSVVYRQDF